MSDMETLMAVLREAEGRAESGRTAFNEARDRYAAALDSRNRARLDLWRARDALAAEPSSDGAGSGAGGLG